MEEKFKATLTALESNIWDLSFTFTNHLSTMVECHRLMLIDAQIRYLYHNLKDKSELYKLVDLLADYLDKLPLDFGILANDYRDRNFEESNKTLEYIINTLK